MKKLIIKSAFVAAFIAVAGYAAYNTQKEEVALSEIAMENVEALAAMEGGGTPCGGPKSEVTGHCLSSNTVNCKDLYGCQ